jgi:hypothetical protein
MENSKSFDCCKPMGFDHNSWVSYSDSNMGSDRHHKEFLRVEILYHYNNPDS